MTTKVKTYRIKTDTEPQVGDVAVFNENGEFTLSHMGTAASLDAGRNVGNVPVVGDDGLLDSRIIPTTGGGMDTRTYDPNRVRGDAFNMDNMSDGRGKVAMTSEERENLANQSGVNTGDQSASDFDIKDLNDSTDLKGKWNGKQDALTAGDNIQIMIRSSDNATIIKATDTTYSAGTDIELDGTQINVKPSVISAGEGINIVADNIDYSAMRGPCDEGYHIPLVTERDSLITILSDMGIDTTNGVCMKTYFKMPYTGYRSYQDASGGQQGAKGYYWTASPYNATYAYGFGFDGNVLQVQRQDKCADGIAIRCFKDTPVSPSGSGRTKIYQGTPSTSERGIYHNSTLGLITIVPHKFIYNGGLITVSDKNLGATVVYEDGDQLSAENCGYYYQWGNNHGFGFSGAVTTSSTQVDVTDYGPGNYYDDSIFIIGHNAWFSSANGDLWGGVTGIVVTHNKISNTGVLSINGQTGHINLISADTTGTETEAKHIWVGTVQQFEALEEYNDDTIYHLF